MARRTRCSCRTLAPRPSSTRPSPVYIHAVLFYVYVVIVYVYVVLCVRICSDSIRMFGARVGVPRCSCPTLASPRSSTRPSPGIRICMRIGSEFPCTHRVGVAYTYRWELHTRMPEPRYPRPSDSDIIGPLPVQEEPVTHPSPVGRRLETSTWLYTYV